MHANTVRYRLRRVADVSGETPTEPRGAFTLQVRCLGRSRRRAQSMTIS